MIVLDNDVIVPLFLASHENSALAERIIDKAGGSVVVPVHWRAEFRGVMWSLMRHGALSRAEALDAWENAFRVLLEFEQDPRAELVLEWAPKVSHGKRQPRSYDFEYVALAMEHGCVVVSFDGKLASAAPDWVVSARDFAL